MLETILYPEIGYPRTAREAWAAPGGSHDRLINILRWLLPSLIGVLAAFLVLAPLTAGGDVSFLLDKNKVDVARERLRIETAQYRGEDAKGQAFTLTAGSAIQRSSAEPIVQLRALAARVQLPDGPAQVSANTGVYDMDSERVRLNGPLNFTAANGYDLKTQNATVDLKQRMIQSESAVTGTTPQGTFSADHMQADMADRTVKLDGRARLRIVPGRAK